MLGSIRASLSFFYVFLPLLFVCVRFWFVLFRFDYLLLFLWRFHGGLLFLANLFFGVSCFPNQSLPGIGQGSAREIPLLYARELHRPSHVRG